MRLGFGDNEGISFAMNKEEDNCLLYEEMAPPGFMREGLSPMELGSHPLDSQNDPCKFWSCDLQEQPNGEEWSTCVQYEKTWLNFPIWLSAGFAEFSACSNDCDSCGDYTDDRFVKSCGCQTGERKYTAVNPDWSEGSPEEEYISVCCVDATQESDGIPVPDEITSGWKLECKPKCVLPECGKWYCKGGGIPGVNEVGCAEFTEGGAPAPEGVEFYVDQATCESQSKCGQWWCNGSGVCQPITQDNATPSPEENWGGAFFEGPTECQNWGCGKYYCGLYEPAENPQPSTTNCYKIDGSLPDPSIRENATLFVSEQECSEGCGKYYCKGSSLGCDQITMFTTDSYSSVFSDIEICNESGCLYRWRCNGSVCERFTEEQGPLDWESASNTITECQIANNGCCPPGNDYDPNTDQCVPV